MYYEASAPEDVGGDFYDLFPLKLGRSGFFLGDVCGKGREAAAVTSLARYTMRAAAMLHETPEAVVMDLKARDRGDRLRKEAALQRLGLQRPGAVHGSRRASPDTPESGKSDECWS